MHQIPESFQLDKTAKLHDAGDFAIVDIPNGGLLWWGSVHMLIPPSFTALLSRLLPFLAISAATSAPRAVPRFAFTPFMRLRVRAGLLLPLSIPISTVASPPLLPNKKQRMILNDLHAT